MNRVKVWVYALVVAAAAIVTLRTHTLGLRADALADLDGRLATAAAQALASSRAVAREASAAAALAARDAKLVEALHAKEAAPTPLPRKGRSRPPPRSPANEDAQEAALREAARAALAAAERALGFDLPDGTVVTAGNRGWLAGKGEAREAEGEAMAHLRGAIAGKTERGHVRLNGVLFFAAAAPAGDGAGLVVLAPLDEAWVKGVAAATGAQATLSVPEVKPVSTTGADAQAFSAWTRAAGVASDVGQLGSTSVALGPVKLPELPVPCGAAPAHRARAVALEGVKNGFLVLSLPTAPAFGGIARFHWLTLLGIAGLLVVGLVLGFFVRGAEAPAALPEELLAAATRIERGDFSARAPALAGQLGTLATALNRAAELAGPAAAGVSARASVTDEFFARGIAPKAEASEPEPAPTPTPAPAPEPKPAARAAPPAAPEVDEETHWQQIFQEFLRTRASCGEPSEGLTFDKFRLKLEGNKAALVSKYGCRTVKFQVYVKDGKAALKATPVK
jgi:hypothetical protein